MLRSAGSDVEQGAGVQQTLQSLDSAVADTSLASASGLGIPQVRALKREIAEIFPASNLPAFLLQGLLQAQDRYVGEKRALIDLRVLFRETRRISLYSTFLAAPATIIHGYQRLLMLAGKDVSSAFPDGTWQFLYRNLAYARMRPGTVSRRWAFNQGSGVRHQELGGLWSPARFRKRELRSGSARAGRQLCLRGAM
ncbi:hypothetical protein HC891_25080 [Candidatus Gracilibacteria bacterium]|nr:hypothetical protein [Candidatus Gracilibacteria bacterium]